MSSYSWRFMVAGGVNQVRLETADDLRNLKSLDQKLWVALACPVHGHDMDPRTMALIDLDADGRVRAPEILAAVDFVCTMLRDPAEIFAGRTALPLASIREDSADAKATLSSARTVLASHGKKSATEITLADVSDTGAIFKNMGLNGDGVVHADATTDAALAAAIGEIVKTVGGEKDRSGAEGITAAKVEAFFTACADFAAWHQKATTDAATVMPLGDATAAAAGALAAVSAKIDDFFGRCRLAAFDPRSVGALNRDQAEFAAIGVGALSADCAQIEGFPLASVGGEARLPLAAGINPAWAGRVAAFRDACVRPILGDVESLDQAGWDKVKATLAPHNAWSAAPSGAAVAGLGAARVAELLAGDTKARLLELIAADESHRADAEAIGRVERLVRYYMHLGRLLRNFVSFAAFYGRQEKAIFQAGTVYFDQRSFDLVLRVEDAGRHGSMAALAGSCLVYFDCVRRSDGRKLTVCAAVTDGDNDGIMVGRNGMFYDREGRDYDAQITKIVDNPISIRQAFWSPYKKFIRTIEETVAKRAAAAEAESNAKMTAAAEATAHADTAAAAGAAAAPVTPPKPLDIGTLAAIGVAVGGISAVLGGLLEAFFGLGIWMPFGILGLMLLISGPSMLIAGLKLRRRSLGPILDADGWAVNAQARINIAFGRSLTTLAALPPGSSIDRHDAFADKRSPWPYILSVLAILGAAVFAWYSVTDGAMTLPF